MKEGLNNTKIKIFRFPENSIRMISEISGNTSVWYTHSPLYTTKTLMEQIIIIFQHKRNY